MKANVAGVVVLYHPKAIVRDNIKTYISSIAKLYIVDNSEEPALRITEAIQEDIPNVECIHLQRNEGIAKALNTAAFKASEAGYDWLLTMDQDSRASSDMVENLLKVCDTVKEDTIGIIAPKYLQQTDNADTVSEGLEEVDVAITSGNLLSIKAFRKVGPFREELFIDYVDHEYCLRLKLNNFKVIINHAVILNHELGDSKNHRAIGRPMVSSHHNYIRRYYITRNRLTVLKEYKNKFPEYYNFQKNLNFKETLKILFFEDDKLRKIKSVMQGYLDFKRNRFGKYRY